MNTSDLINFMAKGAPGAVIVMSAADLKGFAEEVAREGVKEKPRRRIRGLSATSEQAEIVQAIMEVWPETKTSVLAKALGVSKMWIYKLIKVNLSDTLETIEDDTETLADAAKLLSNQE
ncbi:hypothetical protein HDR66_00515 [bacterium]|nr:hypothetical protein [bacterium]